MKTSFRSVCALIAVAVVSTAPGFDVIQPQPAPGDLPDFQKAEQLYQLSRHASHEGFQLGFSHYLGAVKGYRLAKYWLNQNPDMLNHPDVQFGIHEAKEKGQKAAITLEATMSEFQAQGNMQGAHECEEMLGYVNNLLNTVQNGNVQGTQPGLPNQDSYPQGSRPWRAPYGGQ